MLLQKLFYSLLNRQDKPFWVVDNKLFFALFWVTNKQKWTYTAAGYGENLTLFHLFSLVLLHQIFRYTFFSPPNNFKIKWVLLNIQKVNRNAILLFSVLPYASVIPGPLEMTIRITDLEKQREDLSSIFGL